MSVGVYFNARDWAKLGLNQQQITMLDFLVRNSGAASSITGITANIEALQLLINEINSTLASIELNYQNTPKQVAAAIDYITDGPVCVYATAALEVVLNPTPNDGETATVKRMGTGMVTVSAGGVPIDGDTAFYIMGQYESFTFVYSEATGGWNIE
jgi:hypothetical protein